MPKKSIGKRWMTSLLISAPLYIVAPLQAQIVEQASESSAAIKDVLAGRDLPLSILAKDLNASYRRLVVGGGGTDIMSLQMQMIGGKTGVEMGLYFTKGDTITLGSETYLIAYRPQVRINPEVFRQHGAPDTPTQAPKLRSNVKLALSLLNLRTTDSLNDIRPFDRAQDIESPQESTAASTRNMELLGRGVLTWLNARGRGTLPVMGAAVTPALKRTFYPFVHDQRAWANPSTEQLYRPNPNLSRRKVNTISNRKVVWMFVEATPATDNTRGVLFLDGHVERVSPDRWSRIQRAPIQTRGAAARTVRVFPNNRATFDTAMEIEGEMPGR